MSRNSSTCCNSDTNFVVPEPLQSVQLRAFCTLNSLRTVHGAFVLVSVSPLKHGCKRVTKISPCLAFLAANGRPLAVAPTSSNSGMMHSCFSGVSNRPSSASVLLFYDKVIGTDSSAAVFCTWYRSAVPNRVSSPTFSIASVSFVFPGLSGLSGARC